MKHIISVLLYIIVVLIYLIVQDCEIIFLYFAWLSGYLKDLFAINNKNV